MGEPSLKLNKKTKEQRVQSELSEELGINFFRS